ncbi:hypothetical protein Tco_1563230 [Tanacetum coccineum]
MEVEDDVVGDLGEPANYKTAMLDPDKVIWQGAMDEEMNSMKVNEVWTEVDPPPNAKIVRSKWIFKKKTDMDGFWRKAAYILGFKIYRDRSLRLIGLILKCLHDKILKKYSVTTADCAFAQNLDSRYQQNPRNSSIAERVSCFVIASGNAIKMLRIVSDGLGLCVNEGSSRLERAKALTNH